MARKRKIIAPHGAISKIAKDTGFSVPTVRYALRGVTNNGNADVIRKRAIEIYGCVYARG